MKLLGNYCRNVDVKTSITVGVVGKFTGDCIIRVYCGDCIIRVYYSIPKEKFGL